MPRPAKHVSPTTLGGRIRAARKHLHLSLAEVADGHYSTSLISQIERNRITPSLESLRFLANRLQLPFSELEELIQGYHETEKDAQQNLPYEEIRVNAANHLAENNTQQAIQLLKEIRLHHAPSSQRWRLAALRGQCYYQQRQFLKAQQDFVYALSELANQDDIPTEQRREVVLLHLHLGSTYRELQQLEAALEHYRLILQMINGGTPFGYVAEAHWSIALILYAQANQCATGPTSSRSQQHILLKQALEHAENALYLYRSINEQLRVAAVTFQIAQIKRLLGQQSQAQTLLEELLSTWSSAFEQDGATATPLRQQQEIANILSAAACTLAGLMLEEQRYERALTYVDQALVTGVHSYKLRRADAYLMRGHILETRDLYDPAIEDAFRQATEELAGTQRIAARISAHVRFGRHLIRVGKATEGEQQLEVARLLSDEVAAITTYTETPPENT
jgi:transcriptional regulator with XRE-family HTH domain